MRVLYGGLEWTVREVTEPNEIYCGAHYHVLQPGDKVLYHQIDGVQGRGIRKAVVKAADFERDCKVID